MPTKSKTEVKAAKTTTRKTSLAKKARLEATPAVVQAAPINTVIDLPYEAELAALRQQYRFNKRAEADRMRSDKQNESFVGGQFGYNTFLPDAERKVKLKLTQDALARYEKGEPMGLPGGAAADADTAKLLDGSKVRIKILGELENSSRRRMEKIVAKLPGADWANAVPGLSLYGYACVLALLGDPRRQVYEDESGNLVAKPTTPHGIRRYVGLAPRSSYARADDGEGALMRPGSKYAVLYAKVLDGMLGIARPHNNAYKQLMYAKLAEIIKREPALTTNGKKIEFAKPDNKTGASLYAIKLAQRYALSRWLTDLWRIWHGQEPRDIDLTSTKVRAA